VPPKSTAQAADAKTVNGSLFWHNANLFQAVFPLWQDEVIPWAQQNSGCLVGPQATATCMRDVRLMSSRSSSLAIGFLLCQLLTKDNCDFIFAGITL
jgi:hypothetical protein